MSREGLKAGPQLPAEFCLCRLHLVPRLLHPRVGQHSGDESSASLKALCGRAAAGRPAPAAPRPPGRSRSSGRSFRDRPFQPEAGERGELVDSQLGPAALAVGQDHSATNLDASSTRSAPTTSPLASTNSPTATTSSPTTSSRPPPAIPLSRNKSPSWRPSRHPHQPASHDQHLTPTGGAGTTPPPARAAGALAPNCRRAAVGAHSARCRYAICTA